MALAKEPKFCAKTGLTYPIQHKKGSSKILLIFRLFLVQIKFRNQLIWGNNWSIPNQN